MFNLSPILQVFLIHPMAYSLESRLSTLHISLIYLYSGICYTKIPSPSCDKTLDIPTCPESQLLEWKPMLIINLSGKFPAPHFPCCLGAVPCLHRLSLIVYKRCHCLWHLSHKQYLVCTALSLKEKCGTLGKKGKREVYRGF